MDDKQLPKINMHGHLCRFQDIRQRLRVWDEWNVQHFCCLCLNEDMYWNTEKEYFTNDDYLAIKDEYGERIFGFAAVGATPQRVGTAEDVERFRDQGFRGLKFCDAGLPYSHEAFFPVYDRALDLFKKLCFGTDNPEPDIWVPNSQFIMDSLQIPLETRKLFYYGTAARLLGL